MAGKRRTTFDKLQKERNRQAKQAAKRERRHNREPKPGSPVYDESGILLGVLDADGELAPYLAEQDSPS